MRIGDDTLTSDHESLEGSSSIATPKPRRNYSNAHLLDMLKAKGKPRREVQKADCTAQKFNSSFSITNPTSREAIPEPAQAHIDILANREDRDMQLTIGPQCLQAHTERTAF